MKNNKGFTIIESVVTIAIISILIGITIPHTIKAMGVLPKNEPVSSSGVKKTSVKINTNAQGRTTEQENVRNRLIEDNKLGSIKHLYVISAYSGQVIIYSTVKGKVTSGGKRLTSPVTFSKGDGGTNYRDFVVPKIQDDGTYGHSMPYLYWWDTKGIYHQHYISGGQILHISSQPLAVKSIIINMELSEPITNDAEELK